MTTPPHRIRASHDERAAVTGQLSEAYADGRLDADEFDERSTRVNEAKFVDELDGLVADLGGPQRGLAVPASSGASSVAVTDPNAEATAWSVGIFGGSDRSGRWTIAPEHRVVSICGGNSLDLREAVYTSDRVEITVVSLFGGCEIIVPPETTVINHGFGIMGGFGVDRKRESAEHSGPVVHVKGIALMGGCGVTYKDRQAQ